MIGRTRGRAARAIVVHGVLTVLLATGACAAEPPPAQRVTAKDLAANVAALPVVRWQGSWRAPVQDAAKERQVTADVRALGNGHVFGNVTIDGVPATVLVAGEEKMFVKAAAGYWRKVSHINVPERDLAGHWVLQPDPLMYGLDLLRLTPKRMSEDLAGSAAEPVTGTAPPALPPLPWGRPTPTARPVAYPPPSGVPNTAVRTDVVHVDPPGPGSVRNGAYWFTAQAPHRLAGYSGGDLLTALVPAENAAARLTATPGGEQEAKDAYAALAAELRGVPKTVPVDDPTHLAGEPSKVPPCVRPACGPVTVGVRVRNAVGDRTRSEQITVTLYAGGNPLAERLMDEVGSCAFAVRRLKPGKSQLRTCTIDDPRIQKVRREERVVYFHARSAGRLVEVRGPSGAAKLAAALPTS